MAPAQIHFIINPRSSGGNTGRNWQEMESAIRRGIGEFTYEFTEERGSAIAQTARAIKNKADTIVVVGGDGTVSEVVNGFFEPGLPAKKPNIVILNQGTGGDFCRTIGAPADLNLALDSIKTGRQIKVDVGRIKFIDASGQNAIRYFINVAGCGMAGEVVQAINRSSKRFGGFSYFLVSAQKLFTYRKKKLTIQVDGGRVEKHEVVTAAICNGQFFGGGMQISPGSRLGDGHFELVLIEDWNFLQSLWYSKNLYNGTIARCKGVTTRSIQKVWIESENAEDHAIIDCDGEDIGRAPLQIEIIPGAVTFRV
ncbi:MAG: diacylglycerol kinase family lipid kinase [Leptospiraceae bacterium]|nr:diacylglycerol kinase family lipid kinase [Leptospiraceae bacterium]